ncbi:complement C3-like [Sycon ciliatum]|uniref:complement C3-like n=1 Tax=Sycon ciliatum TaxID=27933 RepID=UPI0031F6E6D1
MVVVMLSRTWICLLGLALLQLTTVESCRFVVSAPNVFRVPSDNAVNVYITGANGAVQVRLSFTELAGFSVTSSIQANTKSATSMNVGLTYDNTQALEKQDNNATLVAHLSGGGCNNIERTVKVIITFRACMVLIQTDKPLYTPDDPLAHIRIYPLRPNSRPLDEDVRCYIMDDQDVILDDFGGPVEPVRTDGNGREIRGMAIRTFALRSIYPLPGMYKISCFCGLRFSSEFSSAFQVDEYVLPQYSATIVDADQCVTKDQQTVRVTIRAQYTFGRVLLQGRATIRIGIVGRTDIPESVNRYDVESGGEDSFDVALPIFPDGNSPQNGDAVYIKLQVTEAGSDNAAEDIWTKTKYAEESIIPRLEDVPTYFLPGGAISFKICSQTCAGDPRSGDDVITTVLKTGGPGGQEVKRGVTDEARGGCSPVSVSIPLDTTKVTLEGRIDMDNAQAVDTRVINPSTPCSGNIKATLRRTDGLPTVSIGQRVVIQMDVTGINSQSVVIFQLTSVLGTVKVITKEQALNQPVIVDFDVTADMSPVLTVVAYVYTVANGGECVVATLTIAIEFAFPNPVRLSVNHGGLLDLRELGRNTNAYQSLFQGEATPGSTVRFMAVDEALMILKRDAGLPDTFTPEVIQEYISSFSPVCHGSHGNSAADMFLNSGIALASNVLRSESRSHLECQVLDKDGQRRRRQIGEETSLRPTRRFECWMKPCTRLLERDIRLYCAENQHQTLDGSCQETAKEALGYRCTDDGYFESEMSNSTHSWCVNAIGGQIPDTVVSGPPLDYMCWDYDECRFYDVFSPPLDCDLTCDGRGYQRAVNGCSICRCNDYAADLGKSWALQGLPCNEIAEETYSFRYNYTAATLRCSCHNAVEQGAILGHSYCCPIGVRSAAQPRAFNFNFAAAPVKRFDPSIITTRKNFRSTWLLDDELVSDAAGNAILTPKSVPQSLTSYHIFMTAVHDQNGFGMGSDLLTVSRQLQVTTTCPKTVRLNEDFNVRCTIRNFYQASRTVKLTIDISSELCPVSNRGEVVIGTFEMAGESVQAQNIIVKALEQTTNGPARVKCQILSTHEGDADEREVFVEAEGEEAHASVNIPLNPDGDVKCPEGICQNGGTPHEGVLCCYCECPPSHTGQNCTERVLPQQGEPVHSVRVTPRIVFLEREDDLILKCTAESLLVNSPIDDTATYLWVRRSGREVRGSLEKRTSPMLRVNSIQASEQDDYICEVTWRGLIATDSSKVIVGSHCPYKGAVSDNPCALRFFKPGNPIPSLVEMVRNPAAQEEEIVVDISPPATATPNSMLCRVLIRGQYQMPLPPLDLLEPSTIQDMVRMPTGCGEQMMMSLAPLVYAMNYMDDDGFLSGKDDLRTDGKYYINEAVKAMGGKRTGKCYSVWKGGKPSVWLGAFIVRTICLAKRWDVPKDFKSFVDSVDCILKQQNADGSYVETARVYHKDMTGGTQLNARSPMTAFALLTLIDCSNEYSAFTFGTEIQAAVGYLKTSFNDVLNGDSNFQLALLTYALSKTDETDLARQGVAKLLERATKDVVGIYWEQAANDKIRYDVRPKALTIETTAYVLLALSTLGMRAEAQPVVDYLAQNYNPRGGFANTQETTVAIQSMIEFAKINEESPATDFSVEVQTPTASGYSRLDDRIVNNENYNIRQTIHIPRGDIPRVRLLTRGTGRGIAQVACDYRVLETCDKCPFVVNITHVEVRKPGSNENTLSVTVSVTWEPDYPYIDQNTMFIVHLDFFTGYEITSASKKTVKDVHGVEEVEQRSQSVVVYIKNIPASDEEPLNLIFIATREASFKEMDSVPAVVRVYDYYDPDKRCELFYARKNETTLPESVCTEENALAPGLDDEDGSKAGRCACVSRKCPECGEAICQLAEYFDGNYTEVRLWREKKNRDTPDPCVFPGKSKRHRKPIPFVDNMCTLHREIDNWIQGLQKFSCEDVDYVYLVVLRGVSSTPGSMWWKLNVRLIKIYKNGARKFNNGPDGEVIRTPLTMYASKMCSLCNDALFTQKRMKKLRFLMFGKDSNPLVLEKGSRIMPFPNEDCQVSSRLHNFLEALRNQGLCG